MDGDRRAERAVSVVVPTRERPDALRRCLTALGAQTAAFELIVVDDGLTDGSGPEVDRAVSEAGGTVIRSSGAGPAAARNAGVRGATGDVVLFVDDDCEPDAGWVASLASACPEGGAAAGRTANADPANRFAATSQLLTSALQAASLRPDGALGFAPTSNLAADRDLALCVPFDESFPAAAGEDRDWCARAGAAGAAPRYEPAAVVRHRQQLNGLGGFWRQQVRYGRGAAVLRTRPAGELAGRRMRLWLLRAAFAEGVAVGVLAALAQVAVAWGYVAERLGR